MSENNPSSPQAMSKLCIFYMILGRTLKFIGFLLLVGAIASLISIPVLAVVDPSFELGFVFATLAGVLIVVALIPLMIGYFFMALSRDPN